MTSTVDVDPLAWLREAAASGEVHTVRVAWADRLGALRGKRLPVELFLGSPTNRVGFCDGMIVVDVNCDVIQETPFSNFETGYPDMYLTPRLETLQRVGWSEGEALVFGSLEDHGGEPLAVAPSNVLTRVVERLKAGGVETRASLTVTGRLMADDLEPLRLLPDGLAVGESDPGILQTALEGLRRSGVEVESLATDRQGGFRLGLGWAEPLAAAEQATLAKSALKELGRVRGVNVVFMTRLPGIPEPSCLEAHIRLNGTEVDLADLGRRLAVVRGLLQPSVNAFKAGEIEAPVAAADQGSLLLDDLLASSEADPATVLMSVLSAVGAGAEGNDPEEAIEVSDLREAATALEGSAWVRDWLGRGYIENAVALLRHEAALFDDAVTDWELRRYWSAG